MLHLLRNMTARFFIRRLTTTRVLTSCDQPYKPPGLAKFKKLQAEYQCEDGRPIWLKAGILDRLLYTTTILGCCTGVTMTLSTIYDQAKPPSWKKADVC